MADENAMVFPEDVESIKIKTVQESQATITNSIEEPPEEGTTQSLKSDPNTIVFPDDVPDLKAKIAEQLARESDGAQTRNMIVVPGNCPPGQQKDANGICRDVF